MIIDCHAHVFNNDYVPDEFFGIRLPLNKRILNKIQSLLSFIIPGTRDPAEDVAAFVRKMGQTVEENFLEHLKNFDGFADVKICCLLMDLNQIHGDMKFSYQSQMELMVALKEKYPENILLFLHLDPNKPTMYRTFFDNVVCTGKFDGVKLYPALNAPLSNPAFEDIWNMCEKRKVPIVVHCSNGGVTASGYSKNSMHSLNHPRNWLTVLNKYPNLYLNLAHFGGEDDDWKEAVVEVCRVYPNVFTDFSMRVGKMNQMKTIKKFITENPHMANKTLFGTDFYMVDMDNHFLKQAILDVQTLFGEQLFKQVSVENPKKWLLKLG